MKIGIVLDCLRMGLEESVETAKRLGADGLQIGFSGERPYDAEEIAAVKALFERHGMEISAVCGEMGSFTDAEKNGEKVKNMISVIHYARDLGVRAVTAHIGVIPEDKNEESYRVLKSAMEKIAAEAMKYGITFCIETGPEKTAVMLPFLQEFPGGIGINFDPANIVMGGFSENGADSVAVVGPYIKHTHAKDGLHYTSAERYREVALGQGAVDFPAWVAELKKAGYDGYLTIEREVGDDPVGDCAIAVNYLKTII